MYYICKLYLSTLKMLKQRRLLMKTVYKNPKELATKILDLVDSYRDNLITYEKFENTMLAIIECNEDRVYKNGFMSTKLISIIGEDRKSLIDKVAEKIKR
jgi:uncharacterized protein (TIGR04540 family)